MVVTHACHDVVTTVFTVCFSCCEKFVDSLIQNTLLQGNTCSLVVTPYNHTSSSYKLVQPCSHPLQACYCLIFNVVQPYCHLLDLIAGPYKLVQPCVEFDTCLFGVWNMFVWSLEMVVTHVVTTVFTVCFLSCEKVVDSLFQTINLIAR